MSLIELESEHKDGANWAIEFFASLENTLKMFSCFQVYFLVMWHIEYVQQFKSLNCDKGLTNTRLNRFLNGLFC